MPVTVGDSIGPYHLVCLVGAGGMGEVFRARDTRLNRDVALKVLPDSLADNPERLALFRREALVLASLNHPNIASIYGFEDVGQSHALVMELVEGPTLADRLATGPIPVAEVVPMARQIAEALEAAHDQNVVHRDLKPANIKLRPDGVVKILDFGIAKALEPPSTVSGNPLASPAVATMTLPGTLLGTAAYMSPEQARGKVVDRRTDIWSFGTLVFEMLTGERLFSGDGVSESLSAVLTRQVDWTKLPPDTPAALARLLSRCLERDLKTRLRDIGEARIELARIAAGAATPVTGAPAWDLPTASRQPRPRLTYWLVAAALLVSAAATSSYLSRRGGDAEISRLSVTFPAASPLQLGQSAPSLAFSPDGRTIVYTAVGPEGTQLWLRDLNTFTPTPIPGSSGGRLAFFSPDGQWIGFMANGRIKKLPVSLAPPTEVCAFDGVGMGATWTTRGEIIFATRANAKSLWRVPSTGGTPVAISTESVWYPDALPDGKAVVVTTNNPAASASTGDLSIAVVNLDDGQVTKLFDGGTYVRYSPSGHLVYLRNNTLLAAPFDANTRTAGDTRTMVVDPVYMDQSLVSGNFAISSAGALAYAPGDAQDFKRTIVTLNPAGPAPLLNERRPYGAAHASPDGRRLAVVERAWLDRIFIVDIARQSFLRLTTGHYYTESAPRWSPDGSRIVFRAVGEGQAIHLFVVPSDGSTAERGILSGLGEVTPDTWSPDGRSIIVTDNHTDGSDDLMIADVDGPPQLRPLVKTPYAEGSAAISPDGRWLAYVSNRSGRREVYVSAYPSLSPTEQVSQQGGGAPVWARDSRRLIYVRGADVMAVETVSGSFARSAPFKIASLTSLPSLPSTGVETLPDGRLVAISGATITTTHELRVVLNWFAELRSRVR
jgi:eukaryotic-like serine/threonine-protein kinase